MENEKPPELLAPLLPEKAILFKVVFLFLAPLPAMAVINRSP